MCTWYVFTLVVHHRNPYTYCTNRNTYTLGDVDGDTLIETQFTEEYVQNSNMHSPVGPIALTTFYNYSMANTVLA
jgi:hypothetical protein